MPIAEMLDVIFEYLDTVDLVAAASSCGLWKCTSEMQWKDCLCNDDAEEDGQSESYQSRFLKWFYKEQNQYWWTHQVAVALGFFFYSYPRFLFNEEQWLARQATLENSHYHDDYHENRAIVQQAPTEFKYFVRLMYCQGTQTTALVWNGFVPLEAERPLEPIEADGGIELPQGAAYRLRLNMREQHLSFRSGNWNDFFLLFYLYKHEDTHEQKVQEMNEDGPFHIHYSDIDSCNDNFKVSMVAVRGMECYRLISGNLSWSFHVGEEEEGYGGPGRDGAEFESARLEFNSQVQRNEVGTPVSCQLETMSVCLYERSFISYEE